MTKRSPSYYKYKKEHPTVSFILTRNLKEALDILKEDKSYGQTMKQIIEGKVDEELSINLIKLQDEVSRLTKQLNYQKKLQRFEIPCATCGQPMNITSNLDQWYTEIHPALCKRFHNWRHLWNCLEEE